MPAGGRGRRVAAQECRESPPEGALQHEFASPARDSEGLPVARQADLRARYPRDAALRERWQCEPPVRRPAAAQHEKADAAEPVGGCPERDARWAYQEARRAPSVHRGKAHEVRKELARDEAPGSAMAAPPGAWAAQPEQPAAPTGRPVGQAGRLRGTPRGPPLPLACRDPGGLAPGLARLEAAGTAGD